MNIDKNNDKNRGGTTIAFNHNYHLVIIMMITTCASAWSPITFHSYSSLSLSSSSYRATLLSTKLLLPANPLSLSSLSLSSSSTNSIEEEQQQQQQQQTTNCEFWLDLRGSSLPTISAMSVLKEIIGIKSEYEDGSIDPSYNNDNDNNDDNEDNNDSDNDNNNIDDLRVDAMVRSSLPSSSSSTDDDEDKNDDNGEKNTSVSPQQSSLPMDIFQSKNSEGSSLILSSSPPSSSSPSSSSSTPPPPSSSTSPLEETNNNEIFPGGIVTILDISSEGNGVCDDMMSVTKVVSEGGWVLIDVEGGHDSDSGFGPVTDLVELLSFAASSSSTTTTTSPSNFGIAISCRTSSELFDAGSLFQMLTMTTDAISSSSSSSSNMDGSNDNRGGSGISQGGILLPSGVSLQGNDEDATDDDDESLTNESSSSSLLISSSFTSSRRIMPRFAVVLPLDAAMWDTASLIFDESK